MAAAESLASFFIPTSDDAFKIDVSTLNGSIPGNINRSIAYLSNYYLYVYYTYIYLNLLDRC